ncbi:MULTISPECIES: MFS transporter [unclassified Streptomyces]|uniref:MFS transporter n=1 Tax=unclassified Streptomyces TaxID=2593676 RepID=UPI000F6C945E|nr:MULTISPECIES: MFS transporter [unclassified Streptomyces]AZM64757.1 MFS transporter [Streptomyces sp. WAC 01438]RSN00155.1 MFS transporter [Streptomyces sp. WAC 01420]
MSEAVAAPVRLGWPAIGALGILALALGSLQSVVEPALPLLQRELEVDASEGALIGNALLITGAVAAPVAGKLGDRYGGRRVLVRLMAVVAAGGLMAAAAPSLPVLLLGQVLQGVMVGALPLSFILVRKHLAAGESQAVIGLVVALFTGGSMVGMLFAGPIAEGLAWQWMFGLPTIVVVVATLAVARLVPHDPPVPSDHGIDWPGTVLLSGTLLVFMVGLVTVTRDGGMPPLAVGALALVVAALATGWVVVERRAPAPMVDLRMLAKSAVWRACALTFVISASSGMVLLLLPQMFAAPADGYGFGASTTDIGLLLLPASIAGVLSDSVGGIAARRFGPPAVVVVAAVVTTATMTALASLHTAQWHLVLAKVLTAFAAGVATTALLAGAATAIETEDIGIATSLLVVTRVIGVALGAQVAGAILDAGGDPATGLPAESAFVTGFVVAGLVAALSLLFVRRVKVRTANVRTTNVPTTEEGAQA